MTSYELQRRHPPQVAIVIQHRDPGCAALVQSILRPFVERNAQLYVSSERPSLRRRSDIFVLGDPQPVEGETAPSRLRLSPFDLAQSRLL